MTLKVARMMIAAKRIVDTQDVRIVGATLFIGKHCSDSEIQEMRAEFQPQSIEKIDGGRTKIDL